MKSTVGVVLCLLFTLAAQAGHVCNCGKDDIFAPGDDAVVSGGVYSGQCQYTCEKRSARLITPNDGSFYANRYTGIANVSINKDFYAGYFDLTKAPRVILQEEHFFFYNTDLLAAHLQLRFHFDGGNIPFLIPQLDPTSPPSYMDDVIFSAEFSAPWGVNFSVLKGFGTDYNIVYRFTSLQNRYDFMIGEEGNRVEQLELLLTPEQRRDVFLTAAQLSTESGMHFKYDTWGRNCTTEVYVVLDRALKIPENLRKGINALSYGVATKVGHYPIQVRTALSLRGIKYKTLVDLNHEFDQGLVEK